MEINIPGFGAVELKHLVMDYNGTMAWDGRLIKGVGELVKKLSETYTVHVITADTFGMAAGELDGLPLTLSLLPPGSQDKAKLAYVEDLGADSCIAVGNGRNDALMLEKACIGIALLQEEGLASRSMIAADMVCRDILSALELFLHPKRLVATLRS